MYELPTKVDVHRPPRWLRLLLFFKKPYYAYDYGDGESIQRTIIAKRLFGVFYIIGEK